MTFDTFETKGLEQNSFDPKGKMAALRSGFRSSLEPKMDAYMQMPDSVDRNIASWLGIDPSSAVLELGGMRASTMDIVKQMYNGVTYDDGFITTGLKDIANYKVNSQYETQNINQHAGFAAEVAGTAKENLKAKLEGTGITTYRADDRPDLFAKNDQYVDKIRVNDAGEIIERIQVKFVGKDAADCLSKLTSKKFDKYFMDGKVDKMEVPKDFYDDIKKLIPEKVDGLEKQLQHVKETGKEDVCQRIETKIARLQKIDEMLEQSTITKDEAVSAYLHPKRYAMKLFAKDVFAESCKAGLESTALAVTITAAVSTVDNVNKFFDGEITARDAFIDVAKDTGVSGAIGFGTAFVSTAIAQAMFASSHELIRSLGSVGVPATIVSFGVQSFDSIVDYADGIIDGKQLVYDLGENAAAIGGSITGVAIAGATIGSIVPGPGTAIGTAAGIATGMVGGMIGCALASEAYASAVEFGAGHIDELANKAQEMANKTVEIAREVVPEQVSAMAASINDFATVNNLPFRV